MRDDRLPDAELEVLACLWRAGEATAREIREAMEPYRPLAHASVMTLLGRLESKGYLKRRKAAVGKSFLYKPTRKPDKTMRGVMRDVLERVFAGDGVAMVTSLFEASPPSAEEIAELQRLLDELKDGRKRRK